MSVTAPAMTNDSVIETVVPLARAYPDILALGAYLKNTVCAIHGNKAYVSRVIGDLGTTAAIDDFETVVPAMLAETGITPLCVAHDMHPDFHSTRFASSLNIPTLAVQHHHAHATALMAEHKLEAPVLALTLDGFGLGPDNQSWGGELLWTDGPNYKRLGHLSLLPQPGGDVAAREPWRMASAALHVMGRGSEIASRFADHQSAAMLDTVLEKRLRSPETSSCGRLFDAACGLLNVHPVSDFEGQAPMALEAMVRAPSTLENGWTISDDGVLNTLPLLDNLSGLSAQEGADLFHGTLATALIDWVMWATKQVNVQSVVLGGGCFFNSVLKALVTDGLKNAKIDVYGPEQLSAGDPAISVGQALIAALDAERSF